MADKKIILVTGATGKQGGAVANELLGTSFQVRALTRDPTQEAGRRLRDRGAHVVEGNFDDAASIEKAMDSVYGAPRIDAFRRLPQRERVGKQPHANVCEAPRPAGRFILDIGPGRIYSYSKLTLTSGEQPKTGPDDQGHFRDSSVGIDSTSGASAERGIMTTIRRWICN